MLGSLSALFIASFCIHTAFDVNCCLQLARSEQLKAGAGAVRERDSETRRKEEATEREKREQERQLNKEKLQAWKVLTHYVAMCS